MLMPCYSVHYSVINLINFVLYLLFSKATQTGSSPKDTEEDHVYTDGCCLNNGQNHSVAGVGVYWGPNHPRSEQPTRIIFPFLYHSFYHNNTRIYHDKYSQFSEFWLRLYSTRKLQSHSFHDICFERYLEYENLEFYEVNII